MPEVGLEDLLLLQMIILNLGDEGEKDSFAVRKSKPLFLCQLFTSNSYSSQCKVCVCSQM